MSDSVPSSAIDVHTSFFPLAFLLVFLTPRIAINGVVYCQHRWRDIRATVPAGRYQVEVWLPYFFFPTMGRNGVVVDVPPGSRVQVHWRVPWLSVLPGKMSVDGPFPLDEAPTGAPGPGSNLLGVPMLNSLPAPVAPYAQPPMVPPPISPPTENGS